MNELEIAGSEIEVSLMKYGFKSLSLNEKNQLTMVLAARAGVPYTDITEAYILKRHKSIKTDWLSALCEDAIVQGFTSTNGNLYRTNRDDQINMMGQKDYLDANPTVTSVMWKTENKGYVSHTKAEWLAVYAEAFNHKRDKLLKYNDLKTKVTNATTDEAVVAVQW